MKKFLVFLSLLFVFIPTCVFAEEQNDLFSVEAQVPKGNGTYSITGSLHPGRTSRQTNNNFRIKYNYLNTFNTFQVGSRYRLVSDFCLINQTDNEIPDHFNIVGTPVGFEFGDLSFSGGTMCIFTDSSGNAYTGVHFITTYDFTVGEDSPGQAIYEFLFASTKYYSIAFLDYQILDQDAMTAQDNTQQIINNQNINTQDIINNNTQNTQNIINNQNANQQQTNQRLDDLNSNTQETNNIMKDDTIDTDFQNSTLNNLNGQMATNNVISDLLLLPVTMYQKIINSLNSNQCASFNLGSLYGTNLVLPCIQVQNYIGVNLWNVIDLIFCGMFVLVIRKKFVDIFNNMTNLKDGGNDLE